MERDGSVYSCDHYVLREYRPGQTGTDTTLSDLVRTQRQRAIGEAKSKSLPRYCRRRPFCFENSLLPASFAHLRVRQRPMLNGLARWPFGPSCNFLGGAASVTSEKGAVPGPLLIAACAYAKCSWRQWVIVDRRAFP